MISYVLVHLSACVGLLVKVVDLRPRVLGLLESASWPCVGAKRWVPHGDLDGM